jgi:hypothetical protein
LVISASLILVGEPSGKNICMVCGLFVIYNKTF